MRRIIVALFFAISVSASAQVNFVLNPGFEDYTSCPTGLGQIKLAKFWNGIDTTGALDCRPTYCNTCATNFACSVPSSGYYYQSPHSGNGMIANQLYFDSTVKNIALLGYLQGRFYKKLDVRKSYCVSFYVNLAEFSKYAISDIGAYLDNGTIDTVRGCTLPQGKFNPQVVNSLGIITDTANWVKIQGIYVSNGTEQFITIANFKEVEHTSFTSLPNNAYNVGGAICIYLIDDVSVIESDLPAFAGNDRHIGLGDSTYIGRPQEVGLECTWAKLGSGTVIGTGAGIWVKPTVSTSYVVTQTLCGAVKKDTVLVEVLPLGLSSVNGQTQGYSLVPNPNKGRFELVQSVPNDEALAVHVCDILGRIVYQGQAIFKNGKAVMELSWLPQGMYYLQLQNGQGLGCNLRLLKEE